jgi:uncharacterized membrane protein
MEIAGLPLHPLIVHAAVVFIPLSAVLAIGFAVAPRWRWLTRWPTAVLSVAVVGLGFLATSSGESLEESSAASVERAVHEHAERGDVLAWLLVVFAVMVVLGAWSVPGTTALVSGKGSWESRLPALERVMPVVLVLASVAVLVLVVLVGDSGARAVWAGKAG